MNMELNKIIGFEALWASMMKCKRNVAWKDSVANFVLNGIKEVMKLCLKYFYMDPYDFEKDFYTEFDERMKKSLSAINRYQKSNGIPLSQSDEPMHQQAKVSRTDTDGSFVR